MLGLTDDAAQKCVSRALEKLRAVLNSKGIRSTASVLSIVLLANSLQAAPSALVQRLPSRIGWCCDLSGIVCQMETCRGGGGVGGNRRRDPHYFSASPGRDTFQWAQLRKLS